MTPGSPGPPVRRSRALSAARLAAALLALLGLGLGLGAGGGLAAAAIGGVSGARGGPARVPTGWRTYAYADALISAPAAWQVERDAPCPSSRAPGLLVLGAPQGVAYSCPMIVLPANEVSLAVVSPTTEPSGPVVATEWVNGLKVVELASGPARTAWWVPSLSLQALGSGPEAPAVLRTLGALEPKALTAACQSAAIRADLPAVDGLLGVGSWPQPTPLGTWSAAVPVPPPGFAATYPQFARLVDTGLQVFATLTGAPGAAAFYQAGLDPSRQLVLHSPGCSGEVAGIETLEGSVASRVLGPPWEMEAVTEPGARNGAVFFRGDCPGGAQPSSTTSPCDTVAVYAPTGAPTPGSVTASLTTPP